MVDSYAWIELFIGGEKGKRVRRTILDADEVRTPDIVLAEVSRKYQREGMEERRLRSRLGTITSTTLVTPIGVDVAVEAGRAFSELAEKAKKEKLRTPSLFDAVVLATARTYDSKVLTGDEHFRGLPETIQI